MVDAFWKVVLIVTPSFCLTGFLLSRIFKRNDVADILWGLGFFAFALVSMVFADTLSFKGILVTALVGIWAMRLSLYLLIRTSQKTEDIRYVKMKKGWGGKEALNAFLRVFLLQSLLMVLIAYPLGLLVLDGYLEVGPFDFFGLILFVFGFLFEAIGDYQLSQFKKDPMNKGKILSTGLWGMTRHPNYLGEILIWWGFFCFTLNSDWWAYALLSPILLTFLIVKVSGVAMLDELLKEKKEEFDNHVKSVPTLFPFNSWHLIVFAKGLAATLFLDFLWLGKAFQGFYVEQSKHLARVLDGKFDALPWAVILVYIVIPLGIVCFASFSSKSRSMALFKGAVYGLLLYTTYEFTNLALIKDWPLEMALLDILWGPILCGLAAGFAFKNK